MYCINITDPSNFSAVTNSTGDRTLALFDLAGHGIAFNDNRTDSTTSQGRAPDESAHVKPLPRAVSAGRVSQRCELQLGRRCEQPVSDPAIERLGRSPLRRPGQRRAGRCNGGWLQRPAARRSRSDQPDGRAGRLGRAGRDSRQPLHLVLHADTDGYGVSTSFRPPGPRRCSVWADLSPSVVVGPDCLLVGHPLRVCRHAVSRLIAASLGNERGRIPGWK